jgi:hypothetical protein
VRSAALGILVLARSLSRFLEVAGFVGGCFFGVDLPSPALSVVLIDQLGGRNVYEVGVSDVLVAVGESELLGLS